MTQIIAHRGASGYAPENTMEAFELAAEQGAYGIETDVHLTKDGHLVIAHDPVIGRTVMGEGSIRDLTLKELRSFDCGAWFSKDFAGLKVPLLKDLLALVKKKDMFLNIEIKMGFPYYTGLEEALAEELAHWDMDERLILSSFNHCSVKKMERLRPRAARGFLTDNQLVQSWDYTARNGAQALHPHFSLVTPELIESCHQAGIRVNTYTVNDKTEGKRLIEAGVDCLISNYPDVMLALLPER